MNCSMPGSSFLHYLLEFAQTHDHSVSDAIQPSHPLSPSSPTLNLSQHQGLFQRLNSSHQVAKVLELHLQHQSFQWVFRVDFLYDWLVWFPCCPRDSQESSPAPQFGSINSSALSLLYGPTLISINDYWKKIALSAKWCLCFLICCLGLSLSRVRLFVTQWTVAYQTPPSTGFSRQEYWSGVPLPSPIYTLLYIK